ncbi:MAG: drug:proton antiporter, partial [Alphaproteobacteria bacterium]|nr:drug:proton antiporter [Alphaproteobacteria bacterium]
EALVRRIEKVETAIEPDFQRHFVSAMAIPHAEDPYARLATRIALPAAAPAGEASAGRGRRSGRRRSSDA